jgi:DNA-binding transcriptional regulator GbsR (MarR family)
MFQEAIQEIRAGRAERILPGQQHDPSFGKCEVHLVHFFLKLRRDPAECGMASQLAPAEKRPAREIAPSLSEFELETIDLFIRSVQVLGLPRSIGEIYGFLFAQARPQPMEVLIRRLGISVGSASQGLRFLKNIGAIQLSLHPGDRREFFSAQTELRKLVVGLIKERIQPHLDNGDARIGLMQQSAGKLPAADRAVLQQRVEILKNWRWKAAKALPFIVRLLAG